MLEYIVTGTGRCGTAYMARFLTSIGIPCGHESIYTNKGLTNKPKLSATSMRYGKWVNAEEIVADSSYMAVPFLNQTTAKIIHLVRHPVKVINSFCNYIDYFQKPKPTNEYEKFIYQHCPELKQEMSPYDRAALFYVKWNQMIESDFFHKIEDNKTQLLRYLGCEGRDYFHDDKINTYRKESEQFDVAMLEDQEIKKQLIDLGTEYRYDMIPGSFFI